jgi:ubiquitin-conjugating enzyme E2 G1
MSESTGKHLLIKQFRDLSKEYSIGLVKDNIYEWRIMLEGPVDTPFEGGQFPALISFPPNFPLSPPTMKFLTKGFFHPNVYEDGRVCISILHEHKHDAMNEQELLSEKWRPIIGIEAIIVSVLSMLSEPNLDSPASIEASVMLKNDPEQYKKKVKMLVRRSMEDLFA